MEFSDLIGWFGNVFFVHGVYEIGNKKKIGFYTNIVGNIAYVIQGLIVGTPSLVILSFCLIGLNIRGIKKWKRKN